MPDDEAELVDVVLPGEERAAVAELAQHAARRPQVHPRRVHPRPVQQLRRAVPAIE